MTKSKKSLRKISTTKITIENKLEQFHSRVYRANKISSVGTFAKAITHEITQPLTAMNNYLNLSLNVLEKQVDGDEVKKLIELSINEIDRITSIVRQMKNFAHKENMEVASIDLIANINEAIVLTKKEYLITKFKIKLITNIRPIMIQANQIQIQQLFLNILRNSVDATIEAKVPGQIDIMVELKRNRG